VYDELLEKFSKKKHTVEAVTFRTLVFGLIISCLYLTFSTILPHFEFYSPVMIYPNKNNIFSIYMVSMVILTIFTMFYFGLNTYKNAYSLFIQYRMFNMDTLLTLGSLAAFIMSTLLMVVYSMENINNSDVNATHKHDENNLLE